MSRLPVIAVAVILLAALAGAASAGVMVTDSRITPDVLAPGSEGLLTVTIANSGGSLPGANASTGDPVVESVRLHSTDLTVLSGEYQGIGSLAPGVGVPLSFHVRAPSAPGIYFPEVWIRTAQGQTVRYPLVVNVGTQVGQLTKPAIALEKSVPDAVSPGDPFTVNLSVVNYGSATATDILLTVNASTPSLGVASPGTAYIARLGPGESHPIALAFTTDRKVALGLRTIGATLDYVLPGGSPRRQNESFAVLVRGRAELGLASLTTDPVRVERGQAFTLLPGWRIRARTTRTRSASGSTCRSRAVTSRSSARLSRATTRRPSSTWSRTRPAVRPTTSRPRTPTTRACTRSPSPDPRCGRDPAGARPSSRRAVILVLHRCRRHLATGGGRSA